SPADPNEGWQLIQGYRTKSVEASEGLWQLSRSVKASPELARVFEQGDPSDIVPALERSAEGKQFLADLRAYLDEFGWRSDGIYQVADATWREDPTIPLNTIQGYLRLSEDDNPVHAVEHAAERRQQLTAAARDKLAGDTAKLQRFDALM